VWVIHQGVKRKEGKLVQRRGREGNSGNAQEDVHKYREMTEVKKERHAYLGKTVGEDTKE